MPFVEWEQKVQTLTTDGPHQSFAECVRLGRPKRRFQHSHSHRLEGGIELRRIDAIPVMHDKPIRRLTRDDFSELLECPVSGGVSRNVEVSDPARSHFQDHEDVEHSKCGSDRDEEVAGQNALGMVADERHPTLRRGPTLGACVIGHVASDCARRDPNTQLQQEFCSDPLLTPSRVALCHLSNQLLHFGRDAWPPSSFRLPPPKQPNALPMPPDEGVWLNDGQDLSSREESGKQHQRQPGSILGSLRFGLALQV
jgi:hypothetical protein